MGVVRRPDVAVRRRRGAVAALSLGAIVSVASLDHLGALPGAKDRDRFDGVEARVMRVIDGQTLELAVSDAEAALVIRVWGVHTPVDGRGAAGRSVADDAAALLGRITTGRSVILLTERSRARDERGRLLAHVIADGDTVGAALLEAGLAEVDDRWRHRDSDRFAALELAARRARRGVWADDGDVRP